MRQGIVWRKIVGVGSRPEFWLLCLLLWALASAERSIGTPWAQAAGTEALRWTVGIGLALALGGFLRRTETAGQFLVSLTGALALIGILGGTSTRGDLTGPYQDHQLYGSVLLLLLPFSAATTLSAKSAPWRWGALAALTAGLLCLFLSETRSAWIGLVVAGLVFGGLRLKQLAPYTHLNFSSPNFSSIRFVLVPAALLLLGLTSIWLLSSPPDQKAALTARAATLTALDQDGSWQSRLQLWRGTAALIKAHPALGIGLGRYPGAEWHWTHTGGFLSPAERPSLTNEAHSFYGQTAAEIGIPGLCLYLAVLVSFTILALRRLRDSRRRHSLSGQNALVIAALAALAGQSIDALASPSWQFPEVSLFFWVVLGLGLASLRPATAQPAAAPLPAPLRRAGQWALSGSLAVALATQILPLGLLLTPVEAYIAPVGWKLISTATTLVSPTGPVIAGSRFQFRVIATYKDLSGKLFMPDVTADTNYLATLKYPDRNYGSVSFSAGTYAIPSLADAYNGNLTITSTFKDSGTGQTAPSNVITLAVTH